MKSSDEKCRLAKKFGLYYRCLGDDQLGIKDIGGCKEIYHYLLHREKSPFLWSETKEDENKEEDKKKDKGSSCDTEGDTDRCPTEQHKGRKRSSLHCGQFQ